MIILGSITCLVGIVVFFVLIDEPYSPRLHLTEDEKLIVADRLADNGVYRTQEFKRDQVIEALKDQKTWIFFLCALLNNMTNGALTTFSTLITQGFGFSVSLISQPSKQYDLVSLMHLLTPRASIPFFCKCPPVSLMLSSFFLVAGYIVVLETDYLLALA
jgi:hypothetical protein